MNLILSLPLEMRIAFVFVLGAVLGAAVNWGIYRLAWNPRPIGPWSRPDPGAPCRRMWDRLPFFGWLGLQRESEIHGTGYWVRPMLLELFLGVGLAALYAWEMTGALLPEGYRVGLSPFGFTVLHEQFAAHVVLITLLLTASMIDIDEMIIPDAITVSGTLVGLLIAAAWPWSALPDFPFGVRPGLILQAASPNAWPASLWGYPNYPSLCIGLGCWWLWCVALMTRTWYARHGWRRAVQLSIARLVREQSTRRILKMGAMGTLAIAVVWYHGQRDALGWQGLLSALIGMAAGGGLIWLVRIIGQIALGREAMGFGDVTLMAMIGAFLGWQSSLIVFFLAPIAGLVVGLFRAILFREREIPYGPFLCLASVALIVFWDFFWENTQAVFELGWVVPAAMSFCLVLMGVMLAAWRWIVFLFCRMTSPAVGPTTSGTKGKKGGR